MGENSGPVKCMKKMNHRKESKVENTENQKKFFLNSPNDKPRLIKKKVADDVANHVKIFWKSVPQAQSKFVNLY